MKRLLLYAIGLTLCVAFAPQATADLEDGLVGYWPMDDTTMVPPPGRAISNGVICAELPPRNGQVRSSRAPGTKSWINRLRLSP